MLEVMDFGLDSRFLEHWEALTEGRILALTDLDERRAGALTAAYRSFGENLKRASATTSPTSRRTSRTSRTTTTASSSTSSAPY